MAKQNYKEPPHLWDELFAKHASGTPVAFLRALSWHESRMRPDVRPVKDGRLLSSAIGLMQPIKRTVLSFNAANKKNYLPGTLDIANKSSDMFDPEKNIEVGCWLVRQIIKAWKDEPALREDWLNIDFVRILMYGYVFGWSGDSGVLHVVRKLKDAGAGSKITVDNVHIAAKKLYPTDIRFTANPNILQHVLDVAEYYFRDPLFPGRAPDGSIIVSQPAAEQRQSGKKWLIALGCAAAAAAGYVAFSSKRRPANAG